MDLAICSPAADHVAAALPCAGVAAISTHTTTIAAADTDLSESALEEAYSWWAETLLHPSSRARVCSMRKNIGHILASSLVLLLLLLLGHIVLHGVGGYIPLRD